MRTYNHLDDIEAYEPWSYVRATKTVVPDDCNVASNEYQLNALSKSQIMGSLFWLGRLFVFASSDFANYASITAINDFAFGTMPDAGETFQIKVKVDKRDWGNVVLDADVASANRFIARGSFSLATLELNDSDIIDRLTALWNSRTVW